MPTSVAKRQLEFIGEQWRANHVEAMSCWSFEDLLLLCIQAFEWINREEEEWRLAILTSEHPFLDADKQTYHDLYREWITLCGKFVQHLTDFENRGFVVDNGDRFRACIREAEGILTNDSDFFKGDALVRLCDDAIDESRRGETEDVDE